MNITRRDRLMNEPLSVQQVEHIIGSWIGNGGRRGIWSLCKEYKITINEAYTILRMLPKNAIKKAEMGQKFSSFNPVATKEA